MSKFTYNAGPFKQMLADFGAAAEQGATTGMQRLVDQAAEDARTIAEWNEDDTEQAKLYGDTLWEWVVTGYARSSIQGYVVGNKRLSQLPSRMTTSRRNGVPLRHPHNTDDAVTEEHTPQEGVVLGIVTMNTAYAPYLQEWEVEGNNQDNPVTIEVLEANWDRYYVPRLLEPTIAQAIEEVARRYR